MASEDPSNLELEKLRARKGKEPMEGEGSHSWVSDLHSSLADSGQIDDITDEDRSLITHAFLFPFDLEFTKEDLVRLWIAEGLFQIDQNPRDRVEDDAGVKFDSFVQRKLIVRAGPLQDLLAPGPDPALDFHKPDPKTWIYKLHKSVESSLGPTISDDGYYRISDAKFSNVPESAKHFCLLYKGFDDVTFDEIKRYVNLRTLFIRPHFGCLKGVPFFIFRSLMKLTTVNLSCSLFTRLPYNMKYVESLRYIDLSYTHLNWLPKWIERLRNLQTLKLRGCFNLHHLPDEMCKLTNLRHLDFDVVRQLESMPPRIGELTHLQTLPGFLIDKELRRGIRELKNLLNLTGLFCIARLENVLKLRDVKEAALIDKNYITALVLRWTEGSTGVRSSPDDEQVLEHLRPPLRLQELRIIHYGGTLLSSWISDPLYECLANITLYGFNNCRILPSLGDLPSLRFLHMAKMNMLKRIDHRFCRYVENSEDPAFPRLETLAFKDMPKWEEWTGVRSGDFPCLQNLHLENCGKLKALPSLSCMRKSLKKLELSYCQSIKPFLEGEEPVSLEDLDIYQCPQLKRCFNKSRGEDWPKIAHVPVILIDGVNTGKGGRFV